MRRLIPAHAGKTLRGRGRRRWRRAHPRSRGENESCAADGRQLPGSSPLTRGKPRAERARQTWSRLIPAHAGKTCSESAPAFSRAAHPRSRGENRAQNAPVRPGVGSSPLTRGKPYGGTALRDEAGLIPAHAGKTPRVWSQSSGRGAHPRSRGENSPLTVGVADSCGSSPLTRGKHY